MTEYAPNEQELIEGSTVSEDERRRAIARIKAEAWDEGCEAFEEAHRWDNAEPWQHLTENPYREEAGH